jgi:GTP cyclohydrolase II
MGYFIYNLINDRKMNPKIRGIRAMKCESGFQGTQDSLIIDLPTPYGKFKLMAIDDQRPNCTLGLFMGDVSQVNAPLVRLHSECLTGDVFGSLRCDCGEQLHAAMEKIAIEKVGAIIYLRQEGRGIGLFNKIKAYALQEKGADTVEANTMLGLAADSRKYDIAGEILKKMNVTQVRLMTNNPLKIKSLGDLGIKVIERISLEVKPCEYNLQYLQTKRQRMGHMFTHS